MSNATQTFRGRADLVPPTTPTVYNVVTPGTANTETSQLLTDGTRKFTIKVRGEADLKLAYTATESGTKYISVPACSVYTEENISFTGSLFFQVNKISQTVEIIEWST